MNRATPENVNIIITIFRSITTFCETENIMQNVTHIQSECGEHSAYILSVPHNIVIDVNNVTMEPIGFRITRVLTDSNFPGIACELLYPPRREGNS